MNGGRLGFVFPVLPHLIAPPCDTSPYRHRTPIPYRVPRTTYVTYVPAPRRDERNSSGRSSLTGPLTQRQMQQNVTKCNTSRRASSPTPNDPRSKRSEMGKNGQHQDARPTLRCHPKRQGQGSFQAYQPKRTGRPVGQGASLAFRACRGTPLPGVRGCPPSSQNLSEPPSEQEGGRGMVETLANPALATPGAANATFSPSGEAKRSEGEPRLATRRNPPTSPGPLRYPDRTHS